MGGEIRDCRQAVLAGHTDIPVLSIQTQSPHIHCIWRGGVSWWGGWGGVVGKGSGDQTHT